MKDKYSDIQDFVKDLHKESVKQIILDMGYLTVDDFRGSKACCVFHKEKTPSMQVTDSFFKCYGCGCKGDIINFIMIYNSTSFFETIELLAQHFNTTILDKSISLYSKQQSKLKEEWEFYIENFNKEVKNNTEKGKELIERGRKYFPNQIGYDKNIDYLVLPFTSKTGGILGFTKRIMRDEEMSPPERPKWRHSDLKNSLISNCHNIYNLGGAYKHIKDSKTAYIVEGPGDVAAMIRAGFKNCVAICGTGNFNEKVMDILLPLRKLIFIMDGDGPGKAASKKDILFLLSTKSNIIYNSYVVPMPKNEDPASIPTEELKRAVDNQQKLAVEWYVENSDEDELRELYKSCKSKVLKPKILNLISRAMSMSSEQTIEWIGFKGDKEEPEDSYYKRLLATIGLGPINIEPLDIEEEDAKKILRLRYKESY